MLNELIADDGWDVFVSFASPDFETAKELTRLLERQGRKVFLANQSIDAGTNWNESLSQAVHNSRLIAVLLSDHSDKAHYQREEILLAVPLEHKGKLQIVPIYIDGPPAEPKDWEFGLRGYQRLDLRQLGVETVADRIGGRLVVDTSAAAASAGPGTDSVERQSIGDLLHGAALRIDRTQQWDPLRKICSDGESALFLLHGPRRQNLDLFVSRIWKYLGPECGFHHRPVVVPLRVEYTTPRSAAEWENHLRYGLAGEKGTTGTAEDLLREEARSHPVFLVLSRVPIARRHVEGDGGLSEVEVEALLEFLGDRLPRLISGASKHRHPIRALLATHYDTEADSLVDALDEHAYRGCEAHGVRYRKLPPVRPLEWSDIEDHLDHFRKRPPKRIYHELKAAFERLSGNEDLEFRDILDLLARLLG